MTKLPRYANEWCGDGVGSQRINGRLVVSIRVVNTGVSMLVVNNPGIGMSIGKMSNGVSEFVMSIGESVMSISEFVMSNTELKMRITELMMNFINHRMNTSGLMMRFTCTVMNMSMFLVSINRTSSS